MTGLHDQPTPPHGTDRWGEPVFGDGITTGSYVFMPQPGQEPGERDVFQVAFVGGRPGARDELVAFGWRYDAAAEEWEPYWQSVGPGSVPTYRVAGEQQNETPDEGLLLCDHCKRPGHSFEDCPDADEPATTCTGGVAGDGFVPLGHYADCPSAEAPE